MTDAITGGMVMAGAGGTVRPDRAEITPGCGRVRGPIGHRAGIDQTFPVRTTGRTMRSAAAFRPMRARPGRPISNRLR